MITEAEIYKAVSDLISDSYEWLSDESNKEKSTQYVLGLNDMARYIAEKINEQENES